MTSSFKLPFTATKWQITTYLLGVALFSISFLVFLNSSVSFVITDLIGQKDKVGNAVGTLGFADELVALVACPVWGLLSDRIGVRYVCVTGYALVGLSLIVFVQSTNVYPQLLLARLLFSAGGAATSTMVTAILPSMTISSLEANKSADGSNDTDDQGYHSDDAGFDAPRRNMIPPNDLLATAGTKSNNAQATRSGNSQIAGLVGMFTGVGALIALGLFLPLPARLRNVARSPGEAVVISFYIVSVVAFLVAVACFFGLRGLSGEEDKGFRSLLQPSKKVSSRRRTTTPEGGRSFFGLGLDAVKLGFTEGTIGLGYLGGFVARASSVAISLFIPLYVNAYFISTGLCREDPHTPPARMKDQCQRAYKVAAALTGVSQLSALLFAPFFGYVDGRYSRFNLPLLVASFVGIVGYVILARTPTPDPKADSGGPSIFGTMVLLGFSQIGAIVCSLSVLARGIQGNGTINEVSNSKGTDSEVEEAAHTESVRAANEQDSLLPPDHGVPEQRRATREHLKGSIAGMYSLSGGAGILLLTKLGGHLFDKTAHGAPFYMLAIFNGILLVVGFISGIRDEYMRHRQE